MIVKGQKRMALAVPLITVYSWVRVPPVPLSGVYYD